MNEEIKEEKKPLYSENLFEDEMGMIDSELSDLDDLYKELKTHFDRIKMSQSRGSLTFVKDQTSNLIALKRAKLDYIKQKADMKRTITDFGFKEKSIAVKEVSEGIDELTAEIYKKIANDFKFTPDDTNKNPYVLLNENVNNNEIDDILDEDLIDVDISNIVQDATSTENMNINYSEVEKIQEEFSNDEDDDSTLIVVDVDTMSFYRVDKDNFDIVEEMGTVENIVDTVVIGDDDYAVGESGTTYLTVTLSEDEE